MNARLRIAIGVWLLGWLIYAMVALGLPGLRWMTNLLGWAGSVVFTILLTVAAVLLLFGGVRVWSRNRRKSAA